MMTFETLKQQATPFKSISKHDFISVDLYLTILQYTSWTTIPHHA